MYGMVNQALKEFVIETSSEDAWMHITEAAGQPADDFFTLKAYDDQITYAIVSASCQVLGRPAEDFLFDFGKYWIKFALNSKYRDILLSGADNLFDMLRSLDRMHYQIARTLTELKPPSFRVKDIDRQSVHLYYYSERPGLGDFVRGLIAGLGEIYSVTPEIHLVETSDDERKYLVFLVRVL